MLKNCYHNNAHDRQPVSMIYTDFDLRMKKWRNQSGFNDCLVCKDNCYLIMGILSLPPHQSAFNLRPDVPLKKKGGLILSWSGARIEIPVGAAVGTKTKIVSSPVPAAVRGYACPWLGPNLRLASDVQLIWCSQKLKKPVHCFIPFTYPCTMELTTDEATEQTKEALEAAGESSQFTRLIIAFDMGLVWYIAPHNTTHMFVSVESAWHD